MCVVFAARLESPSPNVHLNSLALLLQAELKVTAVPAVPVVGTSQQAFGLVSFAQFVKEMIIMIIKLNIRIDFVILLFF